MSVSISLILCVSGDFWNNNVVVKNTLEKSGVGFQLLVVNKTPSDPRVETLFKSIADGYVNASDFTNEVSALNHLLSKATGEFIAVVPEELLLSDNWLINTYFDFLNFDQVGCLTVPLNNYCANLTPTETLTKSFELTTVLCSDDFEHYGVQFYSKRSLNLVGAYDESLPLKLSIQQYCYRICMTGIKAVYSTGCSCIALNSEPQIPEDETSFYKKGLQAFNKLKNPFIQLYELSPLEEIAYHALDTLATELSPDCQKFLIKHTGKFGIVLKTLVPDSIKKIEKYSKKYGFIYSISSHPEPNKHYQSSSLTVIFN